MSNEFIQIIICEIHNAMENVKRVYIQPEPLIGALRRKVTLPKGGWGWTQVLQCPSAECVCVCGEFLKSHLSGLALC